MKKSWIKIMVKEGGRGKRVGALVIKMEGTQVLHPLHM